MPNTTYIHSVNNIYCLYIYMYIYLEIFLSGQTSKHYKLIYFFISFTV